MADDEKDGPQDEDGDQERPEDEDDGEVEWLRSRVAELEEKLERKHPEFSPAARWAGWILGAVVAATSLALIVVVLGGGGFTRPCNCPEQEDQGGAIDPQEQAQLERLLQDHERDFQECFNAWSTEHASEVRPGWAVIIRLDIVAGTGGRVENVEASGEGLPEQLGTCLEQRIRRWTFPAPGTFTLSLPFALEGGPPGAPQRPDASPDAAPAARPDAAPDAGNQP